MIRGTTPRYQFELPFDTNNIDKLWLTFAQSFGQQDVELFTLTEKECYMDGVMLGIILSQEQTLKLKACSFVEVQFRVLMPNGTAMASEIMVVPTDRILKEGVLR
jgi:hypothetical protein